MSSPSGAAPVSVLRSIPARAVRSLQRVHRSVWAVLFIGLLAVFLLRQRGTVTDTLAVLRAAHGGWLAALLAGALLSHVLLALTLSAVLAALGHRIPAKLAIIMHAERQTLSTIVPAGSVPSLMLLLRRIAPLGVSRSDTLFSVMLFSSVGHISFLLFLVPVMAWLLIQHAATGAILVASLIVLVLGLGITVAAVMVAQGRRVPAPIERRLPAIAREFLAAAQTHHLTPVRLLPPLGLALLVDIAGAASVYLGLRAVDVSASPMTAATGYAIGTLFLLVAPVFQGLGIVELSMAVTLQHLGVPAPQALAATLIYRAGEVWLPVVFGIALQARHQRHLLGLPAYLPAIWTGLNGVVAMLSVMTPQRLRPAMRRYEEIGPFQFVSLPDASRTVILVSSILLILCAVSLLRWKRTAWLAAVALTAVVAVTQLSKDVDRLSTLIALVNLALLLIYQHRFRVRTDPPTLRRGLAAFSITVAFSLAFGAAALWLIDRRHFGEEFSLREALVQTLDLFFSLDSAGLAPRTDYARWLVTALHTLGGLSVLTLAMALIWPVIWRHRPLQGEREHARKLITAYGRSSQDFFKYWPDKQQFFSSTDDGVVSYGLANGVALVLGDPVAADDEAARQVLSEFLSLCEVNGWEPAFHQATPAWLPIYRRAGLVPLKIGAEAIVHVRDFTLSGKKMKAFRAVMNRFEREGYRATLHHPPHHPALMRQLTEVSDAWLTLEGRRERGFTLGTFSEDYLSSCDVLALEAADGRVEAFINLIPDGAPGEITFDMMRHRPDAPNGSMDMLLVTLIQRALADGFERVSLGMVPFVDIGTGPDAAWRERALSLLTERLGRYFDAESLWRYKNKFGPVWEPRYLVYGHDARLPAIGLAIARLTERPRSHATTSSSARADVAVPAREGSV